MSEAECEFVLSENVDRLCLQNKMRFSYRAVAAVIFVVAKINNNNKAKSVCEKRMQAWSKREKFV